MKATEADTKEPPWHWDMWLVFLLYLIVHDPTPNLLSTSRSISPIIREQDPKILEHRRLGQEISPLTRGGRPPYSGRDPWPDRLEVTGHRSQQNHVICKEQWHEPEPDTFLHTLKSCPWKSQTESETRDNPDLVVLDQVRVVPCQIILWKQSWLSAMHTDTALT